VNNARPALVGFKPSEPTMIDSAQAILASVDSPWTSPTNLLTVNFPCKQGVRVTAPFCRVIGTIHPTPKSATGNESPKAVDC
jgi:hypothetical protein